MIVITDFPTKLVNGSNTTPSRWSSVHQPIFFKGCRRDANVSQVQLLNGVFRVLLPTAPPAGLVAGMKCWLVSGQTNTEVTVIAVSGNQIAVSGNVAPYSVGGYINYTDLRRNYYTTLTVYVTTESNTYQRVGAQDVRPAPNGVFDFDPHGYLLSYAELDDRFLYNAINKKQVKQGSRFVFTYTENWTGSSNAESAKSSTNTFYWANGIKQLQQKYNFNLGAHVLFPTIDTARFMSDFEKPTYFPGFPFSLSFIWSDRVAGRQLQRVEDDFVGAVATTNLDASQGLAVNRMMLAGGYPSSVSEIDVWLNDNGNIPIRYVADGYVATGFVAPMKAVPNLETE